MSQRKFLVFAAIALTAAFSLPAAAQAEPFVQTGLGEPAESITATSSNLAFSSSAGTIKCNNTILQSNLSVNTTEEMEGEGTGSAEGSGESMTGPCSSSSGLPIHITELTFRMTWRPGTFHMTLHIRYTITHPVLGSITCLDLAEGNISHTKGSDEFSYSGSSKGVQNIPPCPTSGTISGSFTSTDMEGSPVTLG